MKNLNSRRRLAEGHQALTKAVHELDQATGYLDRHQVHQHLDHTERSASLTDSYVSYAEAFIKDYGKLMNRYRARPDALSVHYLHCPRPAISREMRKHIMNAYTLDYPLSFRDRYSPYTLSQATSHAAMRNALRRDGEPLHASILLCLTFCRTTSV
jgi:hypothetical protein